MAERIFAVVDISTVAQLVNTTGASIVANARHSIDGSKIILDFNHRRAAVDGLFNAGVDVDAVIAGCLMLSHQEALDIMRAADWQDKSPAPEGL